MSYLLDTTSKTDEALFAEYLDGDESAFPVLYTRHSFDLWSMSVSIVRDADAADDVVQDAFVKLHRFRHQRLPDRSVRSFLFTIGYNTALNCRRKRRLLPSVAMFDREGKVMDIPAPASDVTGHMSILEEREKVIAIIQSLREEYRDILIQHYVEHMTYRELAGLWKIALGTVRNRLQAAIAAFEDAWDNWSQPHKTR